MEKNNKMTESIKTWLLIITFLTSAILGYANLFNEISNTSKMAEENKEKIDNITEKLSVLDEIKINVKNICDILEANYQEK